jgi:hypothetical protein
MKPAVKRWIFITLLVVLIVGTIMVRGYVAPSDCIDFEPRRGACLEESTAALQQKMGEIARITQAPEADVSADASASSSLPPYGFFPMNVCFWTMP